MSADLIGSYRLPQARLPQEWRLQSHGAKGRLRHLLPSESLKSTGSSLALSNRPGTRAAEDFLRRMRDVARHNATCNWP